MPKSICPRNEQSDPVLVDTPGARLLEHFGSKFSLPKETILRSAVASEQQWACKRPHDAPLWRARRKALSFPMGFTKLLHQINGLFHTRPLSYIIPALIRMGLNE
jgi:hypothetical protein